MYHLICPIAKIKFIAQPVKNIFHLLFWRLPIENGCLGLFDGVGSLTHSCSPNTYHTVTKNNHLMIRASVNISQGETINFCKIDLMKCNYFRRKQLQEIGIHCSCLRYFLAYQVGIIKLLFTREFRKKISNILEIEIRNSKILIKNYLHLPSKRAKNFDPL